MTDTQLREELNHLRRSMRELTRAGLNLTAYVEGVCKRGGGTKSAMLAFSGEFNFARLYRTAHPGFPTSRL